MAAQFDPYTTPAAPAPPGQVNNLIDPPTMYPYTIAMAVAVLAITVPAVLVRLFTKWRIQKEMNWEDYILIAAEASLIDWMILYLVQPTKGASIWNTSVADASKLLYWSNLLIVLYCPGILLCKWTIILQIQRIFIVQKGTLPWWLARFVMWSSTIFYIVVGFCDVFECVPREKIWMPDTPGTCLNIDSILLGTCYFNILCNALIVAIPIMVIRGLNMDAKRKVTASVVFGLAALALVAACLRLGFTYHFINDIDQTRNIYPVGYWAGAEMALVVFATAFPTFPRFIEWCKHGDRESTLKQATPQRNTGTWPSVSRMSRGPVWEELADTHETNNKLKHYEAGVYRIDGVERGQPRMLGKAEEVLVGRGGGFAV